MNKFENFTDEELEVIMSALCRIMDDYERGVLLNETEYKMVKELYLENLPLLYFYRIFKQF